MIAYQGGGGGGGDVWPHGHGKGRGVFVQNFLPWYDLLLPTLAMVVGLNICS